MRKRPDPRLAGGPRLATTRCARNVDSSRAAVWLAAAAAGSAATGFCAGTGCAGGADLRVPPRNDRDRVCRRSADADHGRGRRGDADGCGRGAGEWTAAVIPIASGVRVWIPKQRPLTKSGPLAYKSCERRIDASRDLSQPASPPGSASASQGDRRRGPVAYTAGRRGNAHLAVVSFADDMVMALCRSAIRKAGR
jgi:hypothetical protein